MDPSIHLPIEGKRVASTVINQITLYCYLSCYKKQRAVKGWGIYFSKDERSWTDPGSADISGRGANIYGPH